MINIQINFENEPILIILIRFLQFQPFTFINPCFPSKNTKLGPNLARTSPKQKGSTLLTA